MTSYKKLIVCSDGTWNDSEQLGCDTLVLTNVVKIARALSLAKAQEQKNIFLIWKPVPARDCIAGCVVFQGMAYGLISFNATSPLLNAMSLVIEST